MDNGINFSRYLERYLDKETDAPESLWVEKELEGNEALQEEFRLRDDINKALAETDILDFRMQLEQIHGETQVHRPVLGRRIVLWAGSATGIAASTLLAWNLITHTSSDPQALTERYFRPYEVTLNFRSAGNTLEQTLKEALRHYENQQYSEAISLFETLLAQDSMQVASNFYSGISYMELDSFDSADRNLRRVVSHNDNLFIEHAEWYLGFCYLMTERKEKAIEQFEMIAGKDSYYAADAKSILKRLK